MPTIGERLMYTAATALEAWRQGPTPPEIDALQRSYSEKWGLYDGSIFAVAANSNPYRNDPEVYQGIKLLYKHVEAVVDFYAGSVYQGALADEPEQGAIPWKLLVSGKVPSQEEIARLEAAGTPLPVNDATNLWAAIFELQSAWNWQQQKSRRPMYAAALGDGLVELVDNLDRRFVYPQMVWPGYVRDIELDSVDNVRHYVLEYRVEERDKRGAITETYTYSKEVDGEAFRYYKNDSPFDYGDGTVVPNPYGFCPAIWDRHQIGAQGMVRGRSATEGTRQALLQMNSIFSHAFDFQRKAFMQPIGVASSRSGGSSRTVDLSTPPGADRSDLAQTLDYIMLPEGAQYLQAQMDIGKTREMLSDLREGILSENPEASFYQQLREMQFLSAPGADQAIGDVKKRVDHVRDGEDANTVKLFQMSISMCSFRARGEAWRRRQPNRRLTPRQEVFLPFGANAYENGQMDMKILHRPLVEMTESERLDLLLKKESLQSEWAMREARMSKSDIDAIMAEREKREVGFLLEDLAPRDVMGEAA